MAIAKQDINIFYDEYVDRMPSDHKSFLGHFDILLWDDLKEDLTACERLQRKPFYKIALLDGLAQYNSNGKDISLSGKNIVFTDPMVRSSFKTEDVHFKGIYCIFTETFIKGSSRISIRDWPIFKEKGIFKVALEENQYLDLLYIINEIQKEKDSLYIFKEPLIRSRVFDLIHYCQKISPISNVNHIKEGLDERFFKMLENIFYKISYKDPLAEKSPSHFAELLSVNTYQLNRVLKKATGKTTQTLIHERIIEEANIFLRHTDYSIKEISWLLRFHESSHFLNFYKKYMGCTPLEFKKL